MYKRILFPISGKKRGHKAIDALVRALHVSDEGEFILLHVLRDLDLSGQNGVTQEIPQDLEAQAMLLMGPAIEYLRVEGRKFYTRVVAGNLLECIIRVSDEEDADLIIMFNDAPQHLEALALGSTTENVLRNTSRDVLVLHP